MMRITVLLLHMAVLTAVKGREVCYDPLGCFTDDYPWSRTLQRPQPTLPWSPDKINTRFFLFTGENPNSYQTISAYNISSIMNSTFQTGRKSCLIVHGMADRADNNWVSDMCQAIRAVDVVNCIGVDWRVGSGTVLLYVQAANNARLVGAEIAYLMKTWQDQLGYPPSNVHIIGHSLGAHAAGEAGRRFPGVRRITGLDPARLMFEDTPEEVRLDRSDADFVDVIHSDTKHITGLGIIKPIGHFDFYPNGGDHMAGCPSKMTFLINSKDAFNILACNHFRSFVFFTYSVSHPDAFISYPCESYTAFSAGSCFPCAPRGCPSMGYYADSSHNTTNRNQSFYLNTGEDIDELSRWRYKISVLLRGTGRRLGKLYISVTFSESGANKMFYRVSRGLLVPGEMYSTYVDSGVMLRAALNVTFQWTSLTNLFKIQLGAERIEVQAGEDGSIFSFCSNETVLDSQEHYLDPC